ncbi:ZYBA0S04-05578g1_1 [Zygosaccharomyces bailii CLIB 213]|uniref:ATP-dependent RNA helicase SUV3, mitochondrial n=1 Tax=Zygosaccharomyces bailii (strain CLIB 213 / ATCC 58445 / CBS 680 / BCRC 21525 / NBRC 1098 / NCYC 1416 / NRRL Y-2227) TaxID=1333698 RepID=A0A8J2X7X5_ZYGB2|nr:ZYBA0S04-05578g1_1 [Zygosaccharomyces bailii CLIB 213]
MKHCRSILDTVHGSWLRTSCRLYHAKRHSLRIFEDHQWLVQTPRLDNLPPREKSLENGITFKFDGIQSGNIYAANNDFKHLLDSSMQHVYNRKVTASQQGQDNFKTHAWLKLRDHIYGQLKDEHLNEKIRKYQPTLNQLIVPSQPSFLIPQLVKMDDYGKVTWEKILKGQAVTKQSKFEYILTHTYDYIYEQEVIPLMMETRKTDGTDDIDISNPVEWFAEARKMKRHIIMHIGPTNSGKTYRALQQLKVANRGYYAGPLRLLAREIYDRFQHDGVRCNLLTGEEVINDLDAAGNPAGLTSGTVEMVPLTQDFDVVVLDEIQMVADPDRGWAWSNALLGVRAREVHICGEKSTLPLVRSIMKMTGDKLTINEYERLGKLKVENSVLPQGYSSLRKGDCVVAFSKKRILDLKLQIEKKTNLKVAVIYGSLPPETRIQQAHLFNSGDYDVMVASDAIGMGLNLSIDRVIFTTDVKFNGKEMVELTSSNIKQIGGRAGRFKSDSAGKETPQGFITTFDSEVLSTVRKGMEAPIEYLKSAVIWPTDEICGNIITKFPPGTPPSALLKAIALHLEKSTHKLFTMSDLKNKLNVLAIFEHMEDIPFFEKLRLSNAPVKDLPLVRNAFAQFCGTIARRQTRGLLSYPFPFEVLDYRCITDEKFGLELYESLYNIIMLYFWLRNRYPSYFVDSESATDLKYFCELIIFEKLDRLKKNPYNKGGPQSLGSIYKQKAVFLKQYTSRRYA